MSRAIRTIGVMIYPAMWMIACAYCAKVAAGIFSSSSGLDAAAYFLSIFGWLSAAAVASRRALDAAIAEHEGRE
jgi:hypothetical protein